MTSTFITAPANEVKEENWISQKGRLR